MKHRRRAASARVEAEAVVVFIGPRPHQDLLPAEVLRDDNGFVLTGRNAMAVPLARS